MTTATPNNILTFPHQDASNTYDLPVNISVDGLAKPRTNLTSKNRLLLAQAHIAKLKAKKRQPKKPTLSFKKPETSFRLIETADASLEVLIASKAVREGLKKGETVVLVGPEQPEVLIRKLEMIGMNAAAHVKSGKLIIFSSQPAIAGNLSLATNYREVFGELFNLAGRPVDRIVVLKMDLLVNLESQYLAYASVSKFTQAADEMGCKFFAQYSRNHSEAHDRLDAACSSLVNAYFVMKRHTDTREKFQLQPKNIAA